MLTLIIAYLLVAFFFITEGRLRSDASAMSLEQREYDRKSTQWIGLAIFITCLNLLAALVFNLLNIARIYPPLVGWIGVLASGLGIALRAWANRTLGHFYSRILRVSNDQVIVQSGPYRFLRHPGYLGSILLWVGAAVATMNWITIVLALVVMLAVYTYRIQVEEQMLLTRYGEQYREYRYHTWRLIPFIY